MLPSYADGFPRKYGEKSRGYDHHERRTCPRGAGACEPHPVGTYLEPQGLPPLRPQRTARFEQRRGPFCEVLRKRLSMSFLRGKVRGMESIDSLFHIKFASFSTKTGRKRRFFYAKV